MTTILCPYCETELELPNSIRGRTVSCPSCDQSFFITELGIVTRRQRSTEKQSNKCNIHSTQHKTKSPMIPILRWIGVVVLPIPAYLTIHLLTYIASFLCGRFCNLTIIHVITRITSSMITIALIAYIAPSHKTVCAWIWGVTIAMTLAIGLIMNYEQMDALARISTTASLIGCGIGIYNVHKHHP